MATWNIPAKLGYALFVAGDARLGEDARPALNRVLASLANGPPPAVELRSWIAQSARMGTIAIEALRAQVPPDAVADADAAVGEDRRFAGATNAMLIAAAEGAALDARAPWGLVTLAATMASATDGIVYDSGTLRIIPRAILENPLDGFLLGSIKNHVTILSSTNAAGMQTTTTLGLNKYGLFELQLRDLPAAAGNLGTLLAGLAQAMVDARPAVAGHWDVPPAFDVTRLHVAHAFGTELQGNSDKTQLAVAPIEGETVYWRVTRPEGDLDALSVQTALQALDIRPADDEAPSAALTPSRSEEVGLFPASASAQ